MNMRLPQGLMAWLCWTTLLVQLTGCTGLFYQPDRTLYHTPAELRLAYEEVFFHAADGTRLHGWWLPAESETPRATVLFLHGNAENISTHIASVHWLPAAGYAVFLFDYRGYGRSEGMPTPAGVALDAQAALRYLVEQRGLRDRSLVVFGQSLGGAIAIDTVARTPLRGHIAALITESAFSGYRAIARDKLADFWLTWPLQWPLAWTINDDYAPLQVVDRVAPIPYLVMHGEADRIVPIEHGQRLFQAARPPKSWYAYGELPHIAALRRQAHRQRFLDFIGQALEDQKEAASTSR